MKEEELRKKMVEAIKKGNVEFSVRVSDAVANLDMENPDFTITGIAVQFWGPWEVHWLECKKCCRRFGYKRVQPNFDGFLFFEEGRAIEPDTPMVSQDGFITICFHCGGELEKEIKSNGGGIGMDWSTKSAGCGRFDIYIQDGQLCAMDENMGDEFLRELLGHVIKELKYDD